MGLMQSCAEVYVLVPGFETTKKLTTSSETENEGGKK
jgi:hypothetical protein